MSEATNPGPSRFSRPPELDIFQSMNDVLYRNHTFEDRKRSHSLNQSPFESEKFVFGRDLYDSGIGNELTSSLSELLGIPRGQPADRPTLHGFSSSAPLNGVPEKGFGNSYQTSESGSPALEDELKIKNEFDRSLSPPSDCEYGASFGSRKSEHTLDQTSGLISMMRDSHLTNPRPILGSSSDQRLQEPYGGGLTSSHLLPGLNPISSHLPANLHALQAIQNMQHSYHQLINNPLLNSEMSKSGLGIPNLIPGNFVDGFGNVGINSLGGPISLEKAARLHRNGAALSEAKCTWSGRLPSRNYKNLSLSCGVFLGGVPWDITETALVENFKPFGSIKIEWPGKDKKSAIPRGYLYIIFEHESQVKSLLAACTQDYGGGGCWYYRITSRRMRNKEVQVIPWAIEDSNYVKCHFQPIDSQKTVFVGALHGMLNAEGLASIFNELFGGVIYAGIDTDKHKYPIGSGRVTFNNTSSYIKAVAAAFIEINTTKFKKKVQVDPYLERAQCSSCGFRTGPYFCRDLTCFQYYCRNCWEDHHSADHLRHHQPLMLRNKPKTAASTNGLRTDLQLD